MFGLSLPTKIAIALIAFAVYSAFIFKKGMDFQELEFIKEQNELIGKVINDFNVQQNIKLQFTIKSFEKLNNLNLKFDSLKGKVEKSINTKPVFINKDCKLDDETLKLWNGEDK